jgi:choline dehydrogenase-like flavoprotein
MTNNVTFDQRQPVDFAIIGSGSAGGIIAKELSTAGFNVVLFEQGPYRKASDFTHDEYSTLRRIFHTDTVRAAGRWIGCQWAYLSSR